MKKLISIVLCVAMLCGTVAISTFGVNAVDDKETEKYRYELSELCKSIITPIPFGGEPEPFYSSDSYTRRCILAEEGLVVAENPDSTYEELQQAHDKIMNVEMYINSDWALKTYLNALTVRYNNLSWTGERWEKFESEIDELKTALNGGSEKAIDTAYKAINYTFNEMCNSYKVHGDVNYDGRANVKDITLIQKYLTGKIKFSVDQKFMIAYGYSNNHPLYMSIDCVTELQKEILDLTDNSYYINLYTDDYNQRNYVLTPDFYPQNSTLDEYYRQ